MAANAPAPPLGVHRCRQRDDREVLMLAGLVVQFIEMSKDRTKYTKPAVTKRAIGMPTTIR